MTHGTYILLTHLPYKIRLGIGELGNFDFEAGYYAYVGSALGGLENRVGRHLSQEKKIHWHIDHFLLRAKAVDVIAAESDEKMECAVASELAKNLKCVDGFGSSDCSCNSHLFFSPDLHNLTNLSLKAFKANGLKPKAGFGHE